MAMIKIIKLLDLMVMEESVMKKGCYQVLISELYSAIS